MEDPHAPPRVAAPPVHKPFPRASGLALLAPLAYLAHLTDQPLAAFPLSVLALIGGAFLLGESAEVLATRVGEGVGSLLTATLSNLVTLAILGAALVEGLYDVVLASIVGAILGNILLALGGAMVVGGWNRERQRFSREAAASNSTLLLVASFAILMPALIRVIDTEHADTIALRLTLPISLLLLVTYVLGLLFAVRTHRHLFNPAQPEAHLKMHPVLERWPVPILVGSVVMVAFMAETLAETIVPVGGRLHLPPQFLAIILIGAITNSVEIAAAWKFARRDRMNMTIQIATGSGAQVMLFVTPLLVVASRFLPTGLLGLDFSMPMVIAVVMAVFLVNIVAADGESTWYEGVLLLALHAVIAIVFYWT